MQHTSAALPRSRPLTVVARGLRFFKVLTAMVVVATALGLAWTRGSVPPSSQGAQGGPPPSSGS
jgi:hypothetical protein